MLFSFLKSSFQFKGSTSSGEGPVEPLFKFLLGHGFIVMDTEYSEIRYSDFPSQPVKNRSTSAGIVNVNPFGKIETESVNSFFSLSKSVEAKKGFTPDGSVVVISEKIIGFAGIPA